MCSHRKFSARRCWNTFQRILSRFRALTARLLFATYAVFTIMTMARVKKDNTYWTLVLTVLPMVGETIFTFNNYARRKSASKWFSPIVFLFLCSACPSIWLMRLHIVYARANNVTEPQVEGQEESPELFLSGRGPAVESCRIIEQLLLLVLIVGRWLLPRAGISRDQLSQLLLVNIGMAADIIELFEAFREPQVQNNTFITVIILAIWQASLIQFSLAKTATRSRRAANPMPGADPNQAANYIPTCLFCETDLWAITISLLLQDIPFLILRLTLIFHYTIVSYSNIFFTFKNTLIIILQLFRFVVILIEHSYRKSLVEAAESPGLSQHHTFSFMFEQQNSQHPPQRNATTSAAEPRAASRPSLSLPRRLLRALSVSKATKSDALLPAVIPDSETRAPSPPLVYRPPIWLKRKRPLPRPAPHSGHSSVSNPPAPTISFIPKRRSSTQALWLSRAAPGRGHGRRAALSVPQQRHTWQPGDGPSPRPSRSRGDRRVLVHSEVIDDRGFNSYMP